MWYAIDRESKRSFHYLLRAGATFGVAEQERIAYRPGFKKYFNSPACLLQVVEAGRSSALDFLLKYVENVSPEIQKPFLETCDAQGRDALILAAYKHPFLVERLTKKLKFKLDRKDKKGYTALLYLSKQGKISSFTHITDSVDKLDKKQAKEIADYSPQLIATTLVAKKDIGRALTYSPSKIAQAGRLPKTVDKEIIRPYRDFSCEREKQLLRQAATQLYFAAVEFSKNKTVTEIQMMHINYAGNHNLFVAANGFEMTSNLSTLIMNTKLEKLLTKTYPVAAAEGKLRTERFANKLKQRVFGQALNLAQADVQEDRQQAKKVGELLRSATVKTLHIRLDNNFQLNSQTKIDVLAALNDKSGSIYVLEIKACRNSDRHAEEFLADIVEYAKKTGQPVYSSVAGKKRPCLGCAGRMQDVIDHYGDKPGLFWLHTLQYQPEKTAAKTVKVLLTASSYVSSSKDGKSLRDYDSGSDSECDVGDTESDLGSDSDSKSKVESKRSTSSSANSSDSDNDTSDDRDTSEQSESYNSSHSVCEDSGSEEDSDSSEKRRVSYPQRKRQQ
jgi:hypothetical protein